VKTPLKREFHVIRNEVRYAKKPRGGSRSIANAPRERSSGREEKQARRAPPARQAKQPETGTERQPSNINEQR